MTDSKVFTLSQPPSNLAIFIPLGFVFLNLILFTNIAGIHLALKTGIIIHYVSFITLGLAFEIPEMSLSLWCLHKTAHRARFQKAFIQTKKVLSIRYVLTHFIAPCSGMTSMASGLFLAQRVGYSYQSGWLFWITVAATIGLFKGLYQHNLFIRRLLAYANAPKTANSGSQETLRRTIRSPFDQTLIFLEFPTYIFNYWAALYKIPLANPFAGWIQRLDTISGLKIYAGLLIILSGIFLLPILRLLMRRFSRTQLFVGA